MRATIRDVRQLCGPLPGSKRTPVPTSEPAATAQSKTSKFQKGKLATVQNKLLIPGEASKSFRPQSIRAPTEMVQMVWLFGAHGIRVSYI